MTNSSAIIDAVVERLTRLFPEGAALHEPMFAGSEWAYVKECIDTGWVSSAGSFVDRFEGDLASITGSPHAIATVNGTAALHTCLLVAGVQAGDEVLVPSLSFVATANAVAHTGAVPHFADCETRMLGIDVVGLDGYLDKTCVIKDGVCVNKYGGRVIRALIATHIFGNVCDVEALIRVSQKWNMVFIEDAAEALGSYYKGKHAGTFGSLGALSFNGNKIITTGGGGAVLTNDDALAKRAKHITTTAKVSHIFEFIHDEVGYNYRMPNINAALGCAQLETLETFIDKKRALAGIYRHTLSEIDGISFLPDSPDQQSNAWLNSIILADKTGEARDGLIVALNKCDIQARPVWRPLHQLPMYASNPRTAMAVTKDLARRLVSLPSGVAAADAAILNV